jgi:peptide/nickel transport system permease protein
LIALPEFVTGSVLVLLFAIAWPLFPAVSVIGGADSIGSRIDALVLPVAALGAASIAQTSRMIRGSMIEALESDYVQMAWLKGIPERRVVFRHALRNALVPTIQVIALTVAWLVGGVVVVEVVFDYPGIGQALANAVSTRDIPVVQALSLVIAAVYVVVNLAADLATIMLTPKLRRT